MELFLRTPDGRTILIAAPARVGRDPAGEVVLADERASRVHALIWRDGDALCLRDEGSSNGTFINEQLLPPGQIFRLNSGDQFRIGRTLLVVAAAEFAPPPGPAPALPAAGWVGGATMPTLLPPPRRSRLPAVALGGCLALLVLLVCGGGAALAVSRPPLVQTALAQLAPGQAGTPAPATVPPGDIRVSIVSTSPPPTPVSPQTFATNQTALLAAVAELNRLELDFIRRARLQTGGRASAAGIARPAFQFSPITEDDFAFIEKSTIKIAILADQQGQNLAAQGNGNDPAAAAMADTYATLVQQAAALTIKVDELRQGWLAQTLGLDEAADKLALAASAIWAASVTAPGAGGNPFAAVAGDPAAVPNPQPLTPEDFATLLAELDNPASTLGWLAVSPTTGEETLTVPAAESALIDLADPAAVQSLIDDDGPATLDELVQVAGALLGARPADNPPAPSTVTVPKAAVVMAAPPAAGAGQPPPAFPGGKVTIITPAADSGDLLGALVDLDPNNTPTVNSQTKITTQPLAVILSLSDLTILSVTTRPKDGSSSFEAEVVYSFNAHWTTNFTAPQFDLDCSGGQHFAISTVSGAQLVRATGHLILYPGTEDAFCYASRNGTSLGSASLHFLVGEAAGATQRAEQVETDSVALDLTITADALATAGLKQTQAAQTQAVAETADALSTEQVVTQRAEAGLTATSLAESADRFAAETQAALTADDDHDQVTNANDRCFDQAETANGWRDEDGCPDVLPTMNLSAAAFVEMLTNAPVDTFNSVANLTVNFAAGLTSGTLTGSGSWVGTYQCVNTQDPSEVFETVAADYHASYTTDVAGTANGAARTFIGTLTATGVTRITLIDLFTDPGCTFLNGNVADDQWTGVGEVSGTWDGNTLGTLATDWTVDGIDIAGTWSGTVTLTE